VRATTASANEKDLVKDQVDAVVDFWSRENPDLDLPVKALAIRIRRVAHHLERSLREQLGAGDIEVWEAEVLLALRRAADGCRSAGELVKDIQVTSGAITNRVARLEERGWVRRDVDPADRRHIVVSLTPAGLARANELLASKAQAELAVLGRLDRQTQEQLNNDLLTLLLALEGPAQPGDESLKHKQADLAP
jgi:DNA-binding MarR family transcriptional regulator